MSAAPVKTRLSAINFMNRDAFVETLAFAFERSPWVMDRAYDLWPFPDVELLCRAAAAVLESASPEERLALIRAHPELAGKAAIAGDLTAESAAEQAGAGLDRLTSAEYARFQALNAAYSERFDFPFIICVRLNDKRSILAAMERRLNNDRETEIAEAIGQIAMIGRLRLEDAVEVGR